MAQVAVDLDDLETLVLTSGALKSIEGALAQRKTDPFVRPHLEFTEAHDRLATAMRNAKRSDGGTLIGFDEPLSKDERKVLQEIIDGDRNTLTQKEKGAAGEAMSAFDRLAAKGCVVMGQLLVGVLWAGASAPELRPDPTGYAIKATPRGLEKLAKR